MGNPVMVDSDDLETVLMMTGVAKQMEQFIAQHRRDPFMEPHKNRIQACHDRLIAEVRRAQRGELHPDYDKPISMDSFELLQRLAEESIHTAPGHQVMKQRNYSELALKGMIEYGNGYDIIFWSNTRDQQRLNPVARLVVRVTDRGRNVLSDMKQRIKSETQ